MVRVANVTGLPMGAVISLGRPVILSRPRSISVMGPGGGAGAASFPAGGAGAAARFGFALGPCASAGVAASSNKGSRRFMAPVRRCRW